MSIICCTFAAAKVKTTKLTDMEAVRQTSYDLGVNVMGNPIMDTTGRNLKGRPIEEFADDLAKRLGKHYGLNDIREAYLIDPNWKEQPMRAWDDVYEDLCREVGCAYGLNDIREA